MSDGELQMAREWWDTSIIEMRPGVIRFRGYAIEELIGEVTFPAMIWLMLRGELPSEPQADLLGAALVAGVDHGPQAPSIAIARMAITCGLGINGAMASAVNALGDVHGGAGEQALEFFTQVITRSDDGTTLDEAASATIEDYVRTGATFVPGFGHRFHVVDPRAPRLMALIETAARSGNASGKYRSAALAVERDLAKRKGKPIPMNIDGATAAVYGELGFPAPLARGLFILSRSVGILAHAWEQRQQGGRNKGPMPPEFLYRYSGPALRAVTSHENRAA